MTVSLNIALLNAISGLHYNQAALGVVSNNVANANTEGYTRKILESEARTLNGAGAGVNVTGIARLVNGGLLADLRAEISTLEQLKFQNSLYGRMQDMFGSLSSGGSISTQLDELSAALESLAATPESPDTRAAVVNAAVNVVHNINSMARTVQQLRLEADQQVGRSVTNINGLLQQIADLNRQIAQAQGTQRDTEELEDKRDLTLNKLAEEIDFRSFTRSSGEVVILTPSGQTLLDGIVRPLTHNTAASMDASLTLGAGIDGIYLGGVDITNELTGGRLAGAVEMRDRVLVDFTAQLDNLAATLRDQMNAVHNNGAGFPPSATLTGSRVFADTANDVFQATGTLRIAIVDDSGNYAPGTSPTNPDFVDLDLTTLGPMTIDDLVTTINGSLTNVNASIVNGKLVLSAKNGYRIALDDTGTQEVTTGRGFSHYFGLNDLFTSTETFAHYQSARQTSANATVGSNGTLQITFAGMTAPAVVNYTAGTTLSNLATAITAAIAAQGGNATASVVTDGDGVRLVIEDPDGDVLHIAETGGGSAWRDLGLGTSVAAVSTNIAVRSDIVANPTLLSRGKVSSDVPALGAAAVTIGDNRIASALAAKMSEGIVFGAAGGLPITNATFSGFTATMISLNSAQAQLNANSLDVRETMKAELSNKVASISAVNVDEELANLILFQNAYAASARVISVTAEMLEILANLGR